MARVARIVAPGYPHHVTQRGNRRQTTFFCDADYREYLTLLAEWLPHWGNRLWAYCLMPNHVHLVVVPTSEDGLARSLAQVHRRYSRRINFRQGWRGYLWQGRFASVVMDTAHLLAAARYVERNPVKAKLTACAEDWPWSSAGGHVRGGGDALAEGAWLAEQIAGWVCTWSEFLQQDDDPALAKAMRQMESTGRPLGDENFVRRIGQLLGRDLTRQKPGPKPGKAS
jgi:putative transposase